MHYGVFSFSHKSVNISYRDKLAFSDDRDKKSFLKILIAHNSIKEVILLSTCNRTEFIIYGDDIDDICKFLLHQLSYVCDIYTNILKDIVVIYKNKLALEHIFKVASSLESIVIGETQITGQLKDAFRLALSYEFCSKNLSRVIHRAFKCSASIRNKTNISKDNTSIVSVSLSLLKKQNIPLGDKKVLIIGAGDMSSLALRYFSKTSCDITITNRTIDKAEILAQEVGGDIKVARFDNISSLINNHDIIFSATSAKTTIIKQDMINTNIDKKRYWFDMALPQDIDTINNDNIVIYNIDSLKKIIQDTKENREEEAKIGLSIVSKFVKDFIDTQHKIDATPIIKDIYSKSQQISKAEIKFALSKGYINLDEVDNIKKILDRSFRKFLHQTFKKLKDKSYLSSSDNIGDITSYLFTEKTSINFINKEKSLNDK
jgi:glutamyl-tRNA reductase